MFVAEPPPLSELFAGLPALAAFDSGGGFAFGDGADGWGGGGAEVAAVRGAGGAAGAAFISHANMHRPPWPPWLKPTLAK